MRYRLIILAILSFFLMNHVKNVAASTARTTQFSNEKVFVWETVIYPHADQKLKMHRHERDRVVVAFTDGLLKITNDQGKVHYLKLKKNKAYYLKKDIAHEMHTDQNMSSYPVKVLVIELKN